MTTLAETVELVYRSVAAGQAATGTKAAIAKAKKDETDDERKSFPPGDAQLDAEWRWARWCNLETALNAAVKFCTTRSSLDSSLGGARRRLETLWKQLGNNVADLPDWDRIAAADLKTTVSFRNFAGLQLSVVETAQTNFTGNSSEIPTTDFPTQYEEMLDLFTQDLWGAEGFRLTANDDLTRAPEAAADLALWDSFVADAGTFFDESRYCAVRLANHFYSWENNKGPGQETAYKAKYVFNPSNRYNAVNGLFALNPNDLPPQYRARVENKLVKYR